MAFAKPQAPFALPNRSQSMVRTILGIVLSATSLMFAGIAGAQTAATNPQRPARTVESVRPQKRVLEDAGRLDALLDRGLQRRGEKPTEPLDEAGYVRRAYLDLIGRIPTLAETEAYLADQSPTRRHDLVDRLLDSPGHTSHFANYWFDLLRVKSRQRQLSGEPFAHFIRESIQTDKPYDQFVREMLTASGPAHRAGNGATGMLLRDMNMPHDAMANTLRLFLGTRLECAQCHNHPFEHWTQKQFYEMAAYFGGLQYRDQDSLPNLVGLRLKLQQLDDRTRAQVRNLAQRMNLGLDGSGSGVEKLPSDYKYDDLKPGARIAANTIFGKEVKLKIPERQARESRRPRNGGGGGDGAAEVESRPAFADWLANPNNPMFAKVIANRMWARTFGRGLVEPFDDWKDETQAVHPEVMAFLEKLIADLDFDLRQFERVLVHTKLFGRQCAPVDVASEAAFTFRGPELRRMTGEQMWDSLLALVFDDIDERLRPLDERAKPDYEQFEQLAKATADDLVQMVEERNKPGAGARAEQQKRSEAARQMVANDAELQKRVQPLLRELATARRDGNQRKIAEVVEQLQGLGLPLGQRAARGREGDLLRASDLAQPAAPSHLLRQFGQSDRDTVDAASDAATVPQVLTLLNGFLDQRVLNGQSALMRDIQIATDGERRVRVAYLTTVNREPRPDELKEWRRAIAIDGEVVVKDLVWVLCNSNEFRFVP